MINENYKERTDRAVLHEGGSCGNFTTVSQKPSMLFTTLRNPSRSTGLAM
jgi:hypothetical protein